MTLPRAMAAVAAALLTLGCGGAAAPAAPPAAPEPASSLSVPGPGDLATLLPAGTDLVAVGRPAELLAGPATGALLAPLVPSGRIEALARRTGIDAREVEEAVYARYPDAFVVLLRLPQARDIVRAAESRMNTVDVSVDEPWLRRTGYVGTEVRDFVALSEDVLVIGGGAAGGPVVELLARARTGRFPEGSVGAFSLRSIEEMRVAHHEAPAQLHVPRHLDLPPEAGVALLLSRQSALSAELSAEGREHLAVEVELLGEFPPGAETNFRTWVESIAGTDLGAALGIREALETLSIRVDDSSVSLHIRPRVATVARGLSLLFVAEMEDIFGEPGEPLGPT